MHRLIIAAALALCAGCGPGYEAGYGHTKRPDGTIKTVPGVYRVTSCGKRVMFIPKDRCTPSHRRLVECWEEGCH